MRLFLFIILNILVYSSTAQRVIPATEAMDRAMQNQRNLQAANLTVQQQQQLRSGAAALESPQVFGEATPYEPLILGVQLERRPRVRDVPSHGVEPAAGRAYLAHSLYVARRKPEHRRCSISTADAWDRRRCQYQELRLAA